MAITIEELQVLVTGETRQLRRELDSVRRQISQVDRDVQRSTGSIKSAFKTLGVTVAAVGVALALAFTSPMRDAMKFEASLGQINRLMGDSAKAFESWADTQASAFGIARSEAVQYGATYANLLSGFSRGTAETTQRTMDLLKASAVVASSTGRTIDDVMERIRSGLLGNTEAIEDLGINVNVALIESTKAFKEFANGRSWEQLDFNAQQTIRYFAILEQASVKYGNSLAQNTTSRQAAFTAELKNARLALGQAFLPIYNAVLPALTTMARALATAMQWLAAFTQALFGSKQAEQTQSVSAQAGAVSGLGDAYEKAGKQAKGAVGGFDQVNLVGGNKGESGGAGGGSNTPVPAVENQGGLLTGVTDSMSGVADKAKEMAAKVKSAFGSMTQFIKNNSDIIIASLAGVGAAIGTAFLITKWASIVAALQRAWVAVEVAVTTIGAALASVSLVVVAVVAVVALLVAAFVYFYRTNESFRGKVDGILQAIGDAAIWLWNEVLVPFGKFLGDVFVAAWEAVKVAAEWLWKNVLVPFGQFLMTFYNQVIVPLAAVLKDVLGVAFKFVSEVAKSFWEKVLVPLGKALKEMFGPAVEAVTAVLTFLWKNVMQPLAAFIGDKLITNFKSLVEVITWLWKNVLKPVATFVGGAFLSVFNNVFDAIGGIIGGLKTAFIGLMNFITGVFTGDWSRAWNGLKDVFKGITDAIGSYFKGVINIIIDSLNWLIRQMNKIKFDMPDWIPGWAGGGKSFGISIKEIPKLAKGGLAFGPTLAMVGDNRGATSDPEVISPLSKLEAMIGGKNDNREVVAVLKSILQAVKSSGSDDTATISKTDLARAATAGINAQTRRIGKNLLTT
ncbi:hypothetical protein ACFPPD_06730 [Cohnella suwonensis]|uniref:Phage-related protein n=1 Tax=Cohnella suwonensis TaxID=696072 RepID=A0ABW0LRL4_9BACL